MIKDSGKGQYHPARENVCGMTRVTQKAAVCCVLSRNDAFSYISHDERYANCGEILQNSLSEPFYFFLRQRQPQSMALYINGRPVNPIVQFLGTALVIAAVIGLGILLLPLIGGILVFLLLCFVGLALYGWYWRWRHGDPVEALKRRMAREMRGEEDREDAAYEARAEEKTTGMRPGDRAKTGVRRTTVVEDAVVVEEIRRRPEA